jgi:hypothetical protein
MHGTMIEREVGIYATNLANETQVHEHQCVEKMENYVMTCSIYR